MEKLGLIINKNIEIIWEKEAYKSIIQDIGEKYFSISIPSKNGNFIPLRQGDIAEVLYYDNLNIFQFDSNVVGRKFDGIPLIMLETPKKYKLVQRRQFFRVVTLDGLTILNYEKLKDKNNKRIKTLKPLNDKFKKAILIDLSGGGMRVKLEEPMVVGDILHLFLDIQKEEIEIYSKVVRIISSEFKSFTYGICFLDLTEKEREKIIKYSFDITRRQRAKGL